MNVQLERDVRRLLVFLIAVDVVLSFVGFACPKLWFFAIHGVPVDDPQHFLQRTAAAWAAFLVVQCVALARWRADPTWLAVVAGARWSDMFTDWTHAFVAPDMTWLGWLCLLSASPVNLLSGLWLFHAHRAIVTEPQASAGRGRAL